MKRHVIFIVIGLLIVAVLLAYMVTFTVRLQEKTLVLTFGKIISQVEEPGLNFKAPWQTTTTFDTRIRTFQQQPVQTQTQDKQLLIVSTYVNWRIADPRLFYSSFRGEGAESSQAVVANAEDIIGAWVAEATNVFAEYRLDQLVTLEEAQFKLAHLESSADASDAPGPSHTKGMLQRVRDKAGTSYGLEIIDLGIRKLGVPESVTSKVFARMSAERLAEADRLRNLGKNQATAIEAQAKTQAVSITTDAEVQAMDIKGQGDAQAAEYYAKFLAHPQLANFLRKIETLRKTLTNRSTLVVTPDFPAYDLLHQRPEFTDVPGQTAQTVPTTSTSQKDN